ERYLDRLASGQERSHPGGPLLTGNNEDQLVEQQRLLARPRRSMGRDDYLAGQPRTPVPDDVKRRRTGRRSPARAGDRARHDRQSTPGDAASARGGTSLPAVGAGLAA